MKIDWVKRTSSRYSTTYYTAEMNVPVLGKFTCWLEEFVDSIANDNSYYCNGYVAVSPDFPSILPSDLCWGGSGRSTEVLGVYEEWLRKELTERAIKAQQQLPELIQYLNSVQ